MQAWFFLTPIFYTVDLLPESKTVWGIVLPVRRLIYILNPMASIIASYRSILYGFSNGSPPAAPDDHHVVGLPRARLCCLYSS